MARQQKRRRIELGWFEAVVLVVGYIASLGIVGVAGIYIGQRAAHQRLGGQQRLIRVPIPAEDREARRALPGDEPKITFYDELGKPDARAGEGRIVTSTEAPPSREQRRAARRAGAAHGERNTQHLAELPDVDPEEKAAVQGRAASERAVGEPAQQADRQAIKRETHAAAREVPSRGGAVLLDGATAKPTQQPGIPAPPVPVSRTPAPAPAGSLATLTSPRPPARGVTPEAAATARLGSPPSNPAPATGSWSVQVNATREEETATGLADRLRDRGYDAFIVEQARDGVVWYRVRVGRLATIEMANALVREIKEREGLPHAFVASD
jgi:cell division septation protein DedD